MVIYIPKTTVFPREYGFSKRKGLSVFQPSIFRCEQLVSGKVEGFLKGKHPPGK